MKPFISLLKKDFTCLWRSPQILISSFSLSLLLVIISSFAFRQIGFGERELSEVTPGILVIIFLFSGVLALNHSFSGEYVQRPLTGIILTGIDPFQIYLSKFLNNYLFVFTLQLFTLFTHGLFFGAPVFSHFLSIVILSLLMSIGFVSIGTLLSAISALSRSLEILLPLILFPLIITPVAGFVFLLREVLLTGVINTSQFWFVLLVVYSIISLCISSVLFEYLIKDRTC